MDTIIRIYIYCAVSSFICFVAMEMINDIKEKGYLTIDGDRIELSDIPALVLVLPIWIFAWGMIFLVGWWIFWLVWLSSKLEDW